MKKSILIGVLAALMLFAFTACDNTATTGFDQAVISITAEGTPEYFVGDEVSLSDYTVTATRFNGETFVVDAEDLKLDAKALELVATTGKSGDTVAAGTITYTGYTYPVTDAKTTVSVSAVAYTVDAINVVVNADQPTYYKGSSTKNLNDDYTVTAYALDADNKEVLFERQLASDEFTIESANITTDAFSKTGKAELTFKVGGEAPSAIEDGENTASLIVMEDYLESFDFEVMGEGATTKYAIEGATITAATNYIEVTYTMASGNVVKSTDDDIATDYPKATSTAAWNAEVTVDTSKFEEGKTYTITVTAKVGADEKESTVSKDVNAEPNKVVSFTVTMTGSDAIEAGSEISVDDVTAVTATWADTTVGAVEGVTPAVLLENVVMTVNGAEADTYTVPANYPAGTELPIAFSLKNYPDAECTTTLSTKAGA